MTETSPTMYVVGQPYVPGRTQWLETVDYHYRVGGHELRLFFESPSPTEVAAVSEGRGEFALYAEDDVIFLGYRFEPLGWSDQPFSWHLVPEDERILPPEDHPEARAMLFVILVDALTGLVRAMRALTFSPAFTRALHGAIRAQAARPWPGNDEYARQLRALYGRLGSSDALAAQAQARCVGGE